MTLPGDALLARAADLLCRDHFCIRSGESVLVTADGATDAAAVQAILNAAAVLGAKVATVTVPQLPFQGALADPYVPDPLAAAVRDCDVWFDLTFPYLAGSGAHRAAMAASRTRYVLIGDLGAGGLARLYGRADLDRLFDVQIELDRLIAEATGRPCRVTSPGGTDVSFTIAKPATEKLRHANRPGSQTVPGSAVIYPETDSVRGVVVTEAAFHEYYVALPEPIRLEVDGMIRKVEGGGREGRVMDRALRRAGGGKYGGIIHFSHGFHPAARFGGRSFIEDIRVVGSDAIGLGLPWWVPGGGENHPDAVVASHSLWIDGEALVRDGELVAPGELADKAAALRPLP